MFSCSSKTCIVLVVGLFSALSLGADVPAPAPSVKTLTAEKVGENTFFEVSITWPAEGVAGEYRKLVARSRNHAVRAFWREGWPVDAFALIPQGPHKALVFWQANAFMRAAADGRYEDLQEHITASPEVVFVGKVQGADVCDFLLRCPSPEGSWRYLPLSMDLTKATPGERLAEAFLRAQADFMREFEAPADQSFFAYAYAKLLARLGSSLEKEPLLRHRVTSGDAGQLYEVTTGALALQESLQLDRMRNPDRDTGQRDVSVDEIEGVKVESHPWEEMLRGREPQIEAIAKLVPDDQYYVRFTSTRRMADCLDLIGAWGGSLLADMDVSGHDYRVQEKLETQLCLRSTWLSELLGPTVIDSLALTGSDPYLREGTDFTIIFQVKTPFVFEAAVRGYILQAGRSHPDLHEQTEAFDGLVIESFTTPDQVVRCYRTRFDEFYVYSNSPVAVRRVIEAHRGRRPCLAKSLDFVYMRTLYPLNDTREHGFVFLSDAFVRRLVGPRMRIAEKRRLEIATSLEMVKNAALLHLWENPGAKVPTLEELFKNGELDTEHLWTEPGDGITWDAGAFVARSERYGRQGYLTPNIELDVTTVTAREKQDYEQFRRAYQDYWRRYFDPIGIRVTTGAKTVLSVTILPLIAHSRYTDLLLDFGGESISLEPPPGGRPAVLHFTAHLNPESRHIQEIQTLGLGLNRTISDTPLGDMARIAARWVGKRMHFWIEDSDALLIALRDEQYGKLFEIPVVLAVEVKNPLGLATFLGGIRSFVEVSAPNTVVFEPTEPHRGLIFTRVRPAPQLFAKGTDTLDEAGPGEVFKNAAIYYGPIGRTLYVSTSLAVLEGIAEAVGTTQPATLPTAEVPTPTTRPTTAPVGAPQTGHLALTLDLEQAKQSRAGVVYLLGNRLWEAEQGHLRDLWLIAHTVGLGPQAIAPADRVLGFDIHSLFGNKYRYDPARDEIVGSVTGSLWVPSLPDGSLPEHSPLDELLDSLRRIDARLEFTREGLRTEVTFERTANRAYP